MRDGILVVDNNGMIKFANPASAQMFGKAMSSLVGSEIGKPIVDQKITKIEIIKPDGTVGEAEITVTEAEWEDEPVSLVSIICLRELSDG